MKFAITADWHIGLQKDGIIDTNLNISSRIIEVFNAIDYVIDYIIENKVDFFIIAGDIFNISNPSIYYESMLIKRLQKLEENEIITYIILGNHDISKVDNRRNSLISLNTYNWKYINIVTNKVLKVNISDYLFYFVSWNQPFKIENTNFKKVLVGHFHMAGAISGAEKMLIPGFETSYRQAKNIYFYLLGHIHTHQIFQNVLYPGSLTRISLSEKDEKKGFYIVEDFNKFDFIEVPDIFNYKIINITDDKKTWNFDNLTKKDIVRVRVNSIFSNKSLYSKLLSELIDRTHSFDIEINYEKKVLEDKELITGLTPQQAFLQYLDLHKEDIKHLDEVKEKGLNFLEQVLGNET